MRFRSIQIHNFVSHEHTEMSLGENESAFIAGENRDADLIGSNGSGKSLIYDALYWCLYDKTVRGFKKDAVIGDTDAHTWVTTKWLDDDGRVVEVTRYRKHPKMKNGVSVFIDGEDASKITVAGVTGNNVLIKRLFGMDDVAFLYSVVFSKSRGSLCDEKEAGRWDLLSHILGLDRVDVALKAAKAHRKELETLLHRIDVKLATLKASRKETVSNIKELKRAVQTAAKLEKSALQEAKKLDEIRLEDLQETQADREVTRGRIESLEAAVARSDELCRIAQEMTREARKLDSVRSEAETTFSVHNARCTTLKNALVAAKEHEATDCPTCGQYVEPAHVRQRLYVIKQELAQAKTLRRAAAANLKRKRAAHSKAVTEAASAQANTDNGEILASLDTERSKASLLDKRIQELQKPIEHQKIDVSAQVARLKKLGAKNKELKAKIDDLTARQEKTRKTYAASDYWVKGFGRKGLKAYVLNDVLDALEGKANEYLEILSGGFMTLSWTGGDDDERVQDKLSLYVSTANRASREYHYCSEGEKARVWLSMELALNEIARGTVDISLIDECFDGLDKQGLIRAVRLVGGEGKKRRIMCISHRSGVEEFFTRKFKVVMDGGASRVE